MDLKGLEGPIQPKLLVYQLGTLALHTCGHIVLYLPSFQASRKFSPTILLLYFHHNVPPWAHHAFFAWFSYATFSLAHRFVIVSILAIHLERYPFYLFFLAQVIKITLRQMIFHIHLLYFPLYLLYFPLYITFLTNMAQKIWVLS